MRIRYINHQHTMISFELFSDHLVTISDINPRHDKISHRKSKIKDIVLDINFQLPSTECCADTVPEIHDFSTTDELRTPFNPINADQVPKPVAVNQTMQ